MIPHNDKFSFLSQKSNTSESSIYQKEQCHNCSSAIAEIVVSSMYIIKLRLWTGRVIGAREKTEKHLKPSFQLLLVYPALQGSIPSSWSPQQLIALARAQQHPPCSCRKWCRPRLRWIGIEWMSGRERRKWAVKFIWWVKFQDRKVDIHYRRIVVIVTLQYRFNGLSDLRAII